MLWTLQLYIFRETGKTFLLTALGLMVVLGLGGGITNMIQLDQVSAWQMVKLMGFVLPVALALTLPIAALFSAATTYGRLSADNEFVACRSGGVNILTLLAPTLVLSLISALITFGFISYVIPGLIQNLNRMIRADLEQIVVSGLRRPGGFAVADYRFYADHSAVAGNAEDEKGEWVRLDGIVFVETDGDEWVRYGAAETVAMAVDTSKEVPTITADLWGMSVISHHTRDLAEAPEHQKLPPFSLPQRFSTKIKWLNLGELIYYRTHPDEWPDVRDRIDKLRALVGAARFYRRVAEEFMTGGGHIRVGDDAVTYELRADQVRPDPEDGRLQFRGSVEIRERSPRGVRTITGDRAVLRADPRSDFDDTQIRLEVFDNVTLSDRTDSGSTIRKQRVRLDPFHLDPAINSDVASISAARLLGDPELSVPEKAATVLRAEAVAERAETVRDITGVIHTRCAFSVSVFGLVVLAAALGIVFRGSHVLTAFGIAFVPAVFVIVTIVAGRQMAEKAGTVAAGLALLWSGIVIVGGLDAWVLFRVLRR
ncbi:MAG: LptF/LptG family permease [bacterium]|nr:LptF/LptG family permease [bacterium]